MNIRPQLAGRPPADPGATGTEPADPPAGGRLLGRLLTPLDALFDRIYSHRYNPLHQSGNLATWCFLIACATGLYLFLFYRIADPYGSVVAIEREVFLGSFVRAVHRLAAELAMVATLVHLVRKLAQGHTWGPRAFAWVSGVALLGIVLLCGWTGLVMVWDVQALELATQGSRLLDLAPVLSQPLARAFDGEQAVPSSFFFMNLFLHVALPLGLAGGLWLHVSRVARPAWLPARPVRYGLLAAIAVVALVIPAGLAPEADPFALPGEIPLDGLYAFWLPAARQVSPPIHLALWLLATAVAVSLPWWWRPRHAIRVSRVDQNRCTGCETCAEDCPYEAISMVPRTAGISRSALVARVDPSRCVGCGICAGSCAPMGVGPRDWTGREQLAAMRARLVVDPPAAGTVLVLGCRYALGDAAARLAAPGVELRATDCSGSLHTAVIEQALRGGYGGVVVLTCGPRACLFREGPRLLAARVDDGREAELAPRVDRRRLRIAPFSPADVQPTRRLIAELAAAVATLDPLERSLEPSPAECAPPELDALAEVADG